MYYAGVGSRDTEPRIMDIMSKIASILEDKGYILRSGHANGADMAFELGIKDLSKMNIFLPYEGFNKAYSNMSHGGYIYIPDDITDPNYCRAYESLKYHPKGYNMSQSTKIMMIRNFFQIHGLIGEEKSSFNLCWTPEGKPVGGTAQSIRLCKAAGVPVYNLATMFVDWKVEDIVDKIIYDKSNFTNASEKKITSLF